MRLEDTFYLGTITRPHGLKGNMLLKMDTDQPALYENLESVFVEINGVLVPFFLKDCKRYKEDTLNILLEESSAEHAEQLRGKDVYLPLSMLPKLEGKQFYYHEVTGFEIRTENGSSAGKIVRVNDRVPQPYFICELDSKEVNIPVIQDWILEVNREEKYIQMRLPDGLLEIFL